MLAVTSRSASLGTAYGMVGCIVSIALLMEPYTVGWLKQQSGSYDDATKMFVLVSAAGALTAATVALYDSKHGRLMIGPPLDHEALRQAQQAEAQPRKHEVARHELL